MITGSDFDAILLDIGSYIPIRTGSVAFDSFGEGSTTFTTGSTLAIIQHLTERDDIVKQGQMNAGDLRVFIAGNNTDLDRSAGNDKVQVQDEGEWRETEGFPVVHQVGSFVIYKEMLVKTIGQQ